MDEENISTCSNFKLTSPKGRHFLAILSAIKPIPYLAKNKRIGHLTKRFAATIRPMVPVWAKRIVPIVAGITAEPKDSALIEFYVYKLLTPK